jgi:hypothetical protein
MQVAEREIFGRDFSARSEKETFLSAARVALGSKIGGAGEGATASTQDEAALLLAQGVKQGC